MLTRGGLATLLVSLGILAGGRLFGLAELFVLGAGGLIVLVVAVFYVAVRRLRIDVSRQPSPPQVHAGNPCRVDLLLRNRSRLRSPVLRLRDDVSGTQGVELLVAPMAPQCGNAGRLQAANRSSRDSRSRAASSHRHRSVRSRTSHHHGRPRSISTGVPANRRTVARTAFLPK